MLGVVLTCMLSRDRFVCAHTQGTIASGGNGGLYAQVKTTCPAMSKVRLLVRLAHPAWPAPLRMSTMPQQVLAPLSGECTSVSLLSVTSNGWFI